MGTTRTKMTASDATNFNGYSSNSISQILNGIEARKESGKHVNCTCEPYEDIFTFARWEALGFCVRKGETSIKIGSWVPVATKTKTDAETGKETQGKAFLKPHTMCLFCRCQVELI